MKSPFFHVKNLAVASVLVLGTSLNASVISWTTTDLAAGGNNDAFISTNGTSVLAFNGSNTDTGTVVANGVTFQNLNGGANDAVPSPTFTDGGVTFTASNGTGNFSSFQAGSLSDPNIAPLLQGGIFNVPSVSLSGLTPGTQYEIQLIINDSRTGGNRPSGSWNMGINDGSGTTVAVVGALQNATNNTGDFFTGTFTADATGIQGFDMTATRTGNISVGDDISVVPNGGQRQINAFQLRAVPEPSSALLLGLAGLGFIVRRRK
ncbi:PEP-CTERM sorting domain-containing protein [Verrucomicrobiales bacterium]|nr:PEP-CTERM sorting domain-containing protein [Verrucomicrobiales bacterium]